MIVNVDFFFLSHRKDIALRAQEAGWDVTIVTHDTGKAHIISELGLKYMPLPIDATGMNPLHEAKTLMFLYRLYKRNRDAIIHHVGLKNIMWGSLAARLAKARGVVNAVSGLGSLFAEEKQKSPLTKVLLRILRYGHNHKNLKVIFQNHDDERLFDSNNIVVANQKKFIKGSGINLADYSFVPMPTTEPIKIIFTGRMIEEKGILVLAEAARKLKPEFGNRIQFLLVGDLYPNPHALTKEQVEALNDGEYFKWLGYSNNVRGLLAESSIVAFPSYYREGLPKSLIEANAIGRPIITTQSIGCKDTVEDGRNGFLIPIKDSDALAEKLRVLINDSELRERMGKEARAIAERDFSIDDVVRKHLEIYNELLANS